MRGKNDEKDSGTFTFSLEKREDKNGQIYLFGSLRFINSVVFVFPRDNSGETWEAEIKPYFERK